MLNTQIAIVTQTRIEVIKFQVAHCLAVAGWRVNRPIADWVDLALDDDTRLVRSFDSYAVDSAKKWAAHFQLRVDWDLYGRLKATAQTTALGSPDDDRIDRGLATVAQGFSKICRDRGLTVSEYVRYRDDVTNNPGRRAEVNRLLGFAPGKAPQPVGEIIDVVDAQVDGVNELGYTFRVAGQ